MRSLTQVYIVSRHEIHRQLPIGVFNTLAEAEEYMADQKNLCAIYGEINVRFSASHCVHFQ